jgi:acyl-coenzyme A synthetase/AMP-(fatty) acid ligase/thioesterase domain-containing protein/acyl carrier protein
MMVADSLASLLELSERASSLARRIEALTQAQEPVAVLVPPSVGSVVAFHAIARSGRVAVPLDERAPPAVISGFMAHVGARVSVTEQGPVVNDGAATTIGGGAVYYTSGSTGAPKGFVVTAEAQLQLARSCAEGFGLQPSEHVALLFHHSFGAARVSLLGALAAGAMLRVYDARRIPPAELVHQLEEDRVSFAHCAPALLRAMLTSMERGRSFPALRLLATGAEALGPKDVDQFRAAAAPGCVLAHMYATSETGPIAAFFIDDDTPIDSVLVPVGHCLPGKHVVIEHADDRGVGQIIVGGVGLASGYVGNATESATRFTHDAALAPLFRTGDRGRLRSDGVLEHHGRGENVFKIRGYTVDRDEVERAVRSVDSVRDAAVRLESEPRPRLVAYLVSAVMPPPTIGVIRDQLSGHLATQLVPSAYVFLERLPRDERGKIAREALPPVPTTRPTLSTAFVAPANELERAVARSFEEALGIDGVGADDDFFELGGDSLAASEVVADLRATLGRDLTTAAFLEARNVAALAALLDGSSDERLLRPIVTIKTGTAPVPFVCVHGGGGGILDFGALAAALDVDRPFHAVQLGGVPLTHMATVRRLAVHYVECLSHDGLEPPLALGGFSFGAIVAFEMARCLARADRPPQLVVLIDPRRGSPAAADATLRRRIRRRASWIRQRIRLESQGVRRAHMIHQDTLFRMTTRIVERHRLRPYSGNVLLVTTLPTADVRAEWAPFVRGCLDVVGMHGDHNAVLRVPLVDQLARHIENALASS